MPKEKYLEVTEGVDHGFDRGIDYKEIKQKLIDKYKEQLKALDNTTLSAYDRKCLINKQLYCLVSIIQLSNGSRVLEACKALKIFFKKGDTTNKILVKIAKSECVKTNKEGEEYTTKARFRKMKFPNGWIDFTLTDELKRYLKKIKIINLKQRVLDYLLKNFDCNTHSLRYAFINFMLYEKKVEMSLVAKFVGHSSAAQIVRYSQNKKADELFEID
jgi:hypothetical protein